MISPGGSVTVVLILLAMEGVSPRGVWILTSMEPEGATKEGDLGRGTSLGDTYTVSATYTYAQYIKSIPVSNAKKTSSSTKVMARSVHQNRTPTDSRISLSHKTLWR